MGNVVFLSRDWAWQPLATDYQRDHFPSRFGHALIEKQTGRFCSLRATCERP